MIGKLTGIIDSKYTDHIILNVGGVGYIVYCASNTLSQLLPGEDIALFIETYIREEHFQLYGFNNLAEKETFRLLRSVNGIGAKMALAILGFLTITEIQSAITKRNKDIFRSVSGVGAKIAERIVIELHDKLDHIEVGSMNDQSHDQSLFLDATSALTSLGITKNQAQTLVRSILTNAPLNITIDEIIKTALKNR